MSTTIHTVINKRLLASEARVLDEWRCLCSILKEPSLKGRQRFRVHKASEYLSSAALCLERARNTGGKDADQA